MWFPCLSPLIKEHNTKKSTYSGFLCGKTTEERPVLCRVAKVTLAFPGEKNYYKARDIQMNMALNAFQPCTFTVLNGKTFRPSGWHYYSKHLSGAQYIN